MENGNGKETEQETTDKVWHREYRQSVMSRYHGWRHPACIWPVSRASLDEADAMEVELELKWGRVVGCGCLVIAALREKFDRERHLTSQARWKGRPGGR